jgi:HlyD family secretion protein
MSKAKPLRILLPLVVVVLVAAGVYQYWRANSGDEDQLVLFGNVDLREAELAFVVQERVVALYAEEGDHVSRGQVLAEVDPVRFQQAIDQRAAELEAARQRMAELEHGSRPQEILRAKAELASTRASERDARLTYQRLQGLVKKNLASPQDVDNAKAALDAASAGVEAARQNLALVQAGPREEAIAAAQAQVKGAEAALARAQKDLADTRLMAPADGIIQSRILEVGDIASPQKPVFTLALTDPLWVRAYVSEPDLARVRPGMRAEVRSDAFPDKVYSGQVGYIAPNAEFTPKTVQTADVRSSLVYQLRIQVPDSQHELRLGMPVTVTIPLQPVATDATPGDG